MRRLTLKRDLVRIEPISIRDRLYVRGLSDPTEDDYIQSPTIPESSKVVSQIMSLGRNALVTIVGKARTDFSRNYRLDGSQYIAVNLIGLELSILHSSKMTPGRNGSSAIALRDSN